MKSPSDVDSAAIPHHSTNSQEQQHTDLTICKSLKMARHCLPLLALSLLLCISSLWPAVAAAEGQPTDLPAQDRGLTATDIKPLLLAQQGNLYFKDVGQRNFQGSVLGYVTPWNSHGYDVAKRWRAKFTHISPVWYQLRAKEGGGGSGFQLIGGHDADQAWIAAVREPLEDNNNNPAQDGQCAGGEGGGSDAGKTCSADGAGGTSKAPPLIVPRVIFELAPADLVKVLEAPDGVINMIADEMQKQRLDGVVLEGWLQWAAMGALKQDAIRQAIISMVDKLAVALHAAGKVLVLAIPPVVPSHPGRPGAELEHMQQLSGSVDGFSVMTYDYSAAGPGPNAPLPWQEENVRELLSAAADSGRIVSPQQVLMGVPFYGYDFTKPDNQNNGQPAAANPIMGQAYLAALRKLKPKLKWEEQHAEHRVKYKDAGLRHTVYYPTPASLAARIQLAQKLGVGLSIWDIGQGIDSFLDLL